MAGEESKEAVPTVEYTRKRYTLLFCLKDGKESSDEQEVLLGYKKRGFGADKWNGFGGKLEPGETIEQAAMRELKEESGVTARAVTPVGLIEFEFEGKPHVLEVHVFTCRDFVGPPVESEEMRPQWFKVSKVPFDGMWTDDKYWLPTVLGGKSVQAYFKFKTDQETVVRQSMEFMSQSAIDAVLKQQAALPQHRPPSLVFGDAAQHSVADTA